MKRTAIIFMSMMTLAGCSSRPPFLNSEPTIQLVIENASPRWDELTRTYMPRRINKRVNANVVSHQPVPSPVYTLTLSFYGSDREVTGSKSSGIAAGGGIIVGGSLKSKVLSKTTIEATSTLTDRSGKIIWSWVGFAEHKTAGHAVEALADKIAKELVRHRLIEPNLKPLEN